LPLAWRQLPLNVQVRAFSRAACRPRIDAIAQPQQRVEPEPSGVSGMKEAEVPDGIETEAHRREEDFALWDDFMDELRARHLGKQLPPGTPSVLSRLTEAYLDVVAKGKKSA
jgi:hypothetical protein